MSAALQTPKWFAGQLLPVLEIFHTRPPRPQVLTYQAWPVMSALHSVLVQLIGSPADEDLT